MSSQEKRQRRTFPEEFKRDAVNLVVVEGYSFRGFLGTVIFRTFFRKPRKQDEKQDSDFQTNSVAYPDLRCSANSLLPRRKRPSGDSAVHAGRYSCRTHVYTRAFLH